MGTDREEETEGRYIGEMEVKRQRRTAIGKEMEGNRQERGERRRGRGRGQSGHHVLEVLSWQSVLAFLICMPSSSCPYVLVPFELFCSGFPFLAVMSQLSCVLL